MIAFFHGHRDTVSDGKVETGFPIIRCKNLGPGNLGPGNLGAAKTVAMTSLPAGRKDVDCLWWIDRHRGHLARFGGGLKIGGNFSAKNSF
ncbi:hypothetical protein [Rhizobium paknamense]|uniref:Uncharacterized protein n=1 Tax=Rhizobium paknamense TaxID=1206817 RepID=A0ABU0IAX5_9HYPH|nr:hypothetical protein [Rhizobium paknamense]MDQ0455372.1 hypothetical protein [Rhizobium paknamense]